MVATKEVMTPEQVADYLQLDKDTVYRYIREGKLIASRLGRNYRIPKENEDVAKAVEEVRRRTG
ncbi:MAG: helix-turn-helix domain-containing protein [Chloroflexi bacterium]|nr:helix-turn-helix domain-containing protein [Chloroflexota bacterium]